MTHRALPLGLWKLLLAVWFAVRFYFPALAATSDYVVRGWHAESEDGLPENKIMTVLQTRDGYLWIGTYSGLARFDGVRFMVFDSSNTRAMRDSSVTSLFESADGTLWIGHVTGEVTRMRNGHFEPVDLLSRHSGGKIQRFGQDSAGDIWLLAGSGLLMRLRDGMSVIPPAGQATNLLGMANSADGAIWIARAGRLSCLQNGQITGFEFPNEGTNRYTQGICAARGGGIWIANDGRLRKWQQGQWVQEITPVPWEGTPFHTFMETADGRLAAGTSDHGFYLVDIKGNGEVLQFCRSNGFASDWVLSLCEDREGGVWVGTGGSGLFAARRRRVECVSPGDQWQGRAVLSVTPGRNDTLWVGTEGAGVYRFRNGQWNNFAKDAGIRNPYIWSLVEDDSGTLWAGTWGGSLYRQRGERFERARQLEGLTTPMPALARGPDSAILIGTGAGLLRYDEDEPAWLVREEDCPPQDIRTVVERDGVIWYGMYGRGLGRLKEGHATVFRRQDGLASDFVQCLHFDRDGSLWIGTFGGGLNRLRDGHFATIDRERGLPNPTICHIEEDELGSVWMSSHGGLIRTSKAELDDCADGKIEKIQCLTYGLSDDSNPPGAKPRMGGFGSRPAKVWRLSIH